MRKLCTDISDFEAYPSEQLHVDLNHLATRLTEEGVSDIALKEPMLMVFFEDLKTVARVFPSGKMLIQANLKEDAERTCELVYRLISWSADQPNMGNMNCQLVAIIDRYSHGV